MLRGMNLSIKSSELKSLILKRAGEIEHDFACHLAAKREIEAMPSGYVLEPVHAPIGGQMVEGGFDTGQHEKRLIAEQNYNSLCQSDAITRQVQWMRAVAGLIDSWSIDCEISLDDLVVLKLWPSGRGEIATAYKLL